MSDPHATSPASLADRVAIDLAPRPADDERVVATNPGREAMDDEAAFEAEPGPDNCTVDAE